MCSITHCRDLSKVFVLSYFLAGMGKECPKEISTSTSISEGLDKRQEDISVGPSPTSSSVVNDGATTSAPPSSLPDPRPEVPDTSAQTASETHASNRVSTTNPNTNTDAGEREPSSEVAGVIPSETNPEQAREGDNRGAHGVRNRIRRARPPRRRRRTVELLEILHLSTKMHERCLEQQLQEAKAEGKRLLEAMNQRDEQQQNENMNEEDDAGEEG